MINSRHYKGGIKLDMEVFTDESIHECISFMKELKHSVTFQCRNVTIMKNAQGDRVIIQEVKL